ncbi:PAS domain-containing protein [Methanolinea mesophila]|uniref:PAS domain-containing protein n=1 Tax=Methanolinea mesophila TaxID=547055 RepID=UPI001AE35D0A|nr:PAS domain-containing protein [Methanolinea mesophila]MBP1928729.1 PAS domain-containing protein [Methanolinea mesophila]
MKPQDAEYQIKGILECNRRGLTVQEIARRQKMNRNSVNKYLEILVAKGEAEYRTFGVCRVFYPMKRVPAQALLMFSSELICMVDQHDCLLAANPQFREFFGIEDDLAIQGKDIGNIPTPVREVPYLAALVSGLCGEKEITREFTLRKGDPGPRENVFHFSARGVPTLFEDGVRGTTVLLKDLTAQMEYLHNLEFLARTSATLADMGDDENIYQYIADRTAELVPGSMVGVSSVNPRTNTLLLAAVGGDPGLIQGLFSGLGISPEGSLFAMENAPEATPFLTMSQLEEGAERLYLQLFRMFPEELCDRIQEQLELGKNYAMGCVCRGGLYGSVTIRLKKGNEIRNKETIEAFVRQAGVALQRRYAREKLARAEARIMELEGRECNQG